MKFNRRIILSLWPVSRPSHAIDRRSPELPKTCHPEFRQSWNLTRIMHLLLLNFVLVSFVTGEEKKILWHLSEGDRLRIRVTQITGAETQIGEKHSALSMLTAMELQWRVNQIHEDGTMDLSQAFTRMIVENTPVEGAKVAYDSASRETPPVELKEIASTLRPLLASRCTLRLSPRGEISEVVPSGETESLLRDIPAYARWKNLLSEEGLNRTLRQCLGLMPAGPVQLGDTWQQRYEIKSPTGKLQVVSSFEYQGTERDGRRSLEVIRSSTTVKHPEQVRGAFDDSAARGNNFVSCFHFDAEAGHLVRSQVTQTITSQDTMTDPPIRVTTSSSLSTKIETVVVE